MTSARKLGLVLGGALALAAVGCGGGSSLFNNLEPFPGGDQGPSDPDFVVTSVLPQHGQVWEVNRPITITFSKPVAPSSVSAASIPIHQVGSTIPALGNYSVVNGTQVVFQPTCPTSTTQGGLQAGSVAYIISVPSSKDPGATTVTSTGGDGLGSGQQVIFTTPPVGPNQFFDPKVNQAPQLLSATFTTADSAGEVSLPFSAPNVIPLNKFVGPPVFFTLTFDQPVDPSAFNISSQALVLRFEDPAGSGTYAPVPINVTLVQNCTVTGAEVRITPLGVLPSDRRLRLVVTQAFADIAGETNLFDTTTPTSVPLEPRVAVAASPDFDAIIEEFTTDANEDPAPGFVEPLAEWGVGGKLQAAFNFVGQPTTFDLEFTTGTTFIDTSAAQLSSTTGTIQTFFGGNIFLRSLNIGANATVRGQGPNPLRFFVTESVTIAGTLSVDGTGSPGVVSIQAAAVSPQAGGPGQCGGGNGGVGNPVITQSSAKGAPGNGSFNVPNGGGDGGESALHCCAPTPCLEIEDRHPAGGGGGSYTTPGERGNNGTPKNNTFTVGTCGGTTANANQGTSAVDPSHEPFGGAPGPIPFSINNIPTDNFLGVSLFKKGTASGGTTATVTAAPGSFAATDQDKLIAVFKAPTIPQRFWETGTAACNNSPQDLLACPNSLVQVRKIVAPITPTSVTLSPALPTAPQVGDFWVVYGGGGTEVGELVQALGGQGGGGGGNVVASLTFPNTTNNYALNDKVGAGGGGGGGILEIQCLGGITITGVVTADGGDGGGGESTSGTNRVAGGSGGGSGGSVILQSASAINVSALTARVTARGGLRGAGYQNTFLDPVPPATVSGMGHGGRGGKGLVEFRAPFDQAGNQPNVTFAANQPASANFDPAPLFAIPTFGPQSRARSRWFDTGLASQISGGSLPQFSFAGTTPATGSIAANANGTIPDLPPSASGVIGSAFVTQNAVLLLTASLGPQAQAEPRILRQDRLIVGANRGTITGVVVGPGSVILSTDNTAANPLNAGLAANANWSIIPRFFEVSTLTAAGEFVDFLPQELAPTDQAARVEITFQGANADPTGAVDPSTIVPDPNAQPNGTGDITQLVDGAGDRLRFIRFNVGFNINAASAGILSPTSPRPRLNFVKMPFRFN